MNTEKISVHKALVELKTLDKKIKDKIDDLIYFIPLRENNQKFNGTPIEEIKQNEKEKFQSVMTLINRREAIKRALSLSNATTKIKVQGKEYSVSEAIEMKNTGILNYSYLTTMIKKIYDATGVKVNLMNKDIEQRADNYVFALFGKESKVNNDDVDKAREDYIKANTNKVVDLLNYKETLKTIEEFVDGFFNEIDAALSVSNAITEIEFSYETM